MSKEEMEISPVIIAAVDLMKKVNEGLEVEYLSGMRRAAIGKNENGILALIGVSTKMTFFGIEKHVFLGYQHCEDMLNPMGHILAEELIMSIFKDDFLEKYKELNQNKDESN
jgi:hypothetical protein